jgi:hypothetical protein
MQMQKDMKQKIYFQGSFYNAVELDDCIKSMGRLADYFQELIDTGNFEENDLVQELDIITDLLALFSNVKG